ncbi:MAG: hypothetical protein U0103_23660 [Candidatus Obscuribacterales bacterium]
MKIQNLVFKTSVVVVALGSATISAAPSHAQSPGRTYQYAYFCPTPQGAHDSTEVFSNVSNGRVRSTALSMTTAANGTSIPNTVIVDPRTPRFTSLELDAKGNDSNTVAFLGVANPDGLYRAAIWYLTRAQATFPTKFTPAGYTHYRLLISNSDLLRFGSIDQNAKFGNAGVAQMPNSSTQTTVSIANFSLNSFGVPNSEIIVAPSVAACTYIDLSLRP